MKIITNGDLMPNFCSKIKNAFSSVASSWDKVSPETERQVSTALVAAGAVVSHFSKSPTFFYLTAGLLVADVARKGIKKYLKKENVKQPTLDEEMQNVGEQLKEAKAKERAVKAAVGQLEAKSAELSKRLDKETEERRKKLRLEPLTDLPAASNEEFYN